MARRAVTTPYLEAHFSATIWEDGHHFVPFNLKSGKAAVAAFSRTTNSNGSRRRRHRKRTHSVEWEFLRALCESTNIYIWPSCLKKKSCKNILQSDTLFAHAIQKCGWPNSVEKRAFLTYRRANIFVCVFNDLCGIFAGSMLTKHLHAHFLDKTLISISFFGEKNECGRSEIKGGVLSKAHDGIVIRQNNFTDCVRQSRFAICQFRSINWTTV